MQQEESLRRRERELTQGVGLTWNPGDSIGPALVTIGGTEYVIGGRVSPDWESGR